jgi:hypothetical protein
MSSDLLFGPFTLDVSDNLVATTITDTDSILYIVKGRYCKDNFMANENYKAEIKKYLMYEKYYLNKRTKAFFVCPEFDKTSHSVTKYVSVAFQKSPGVRNYEVFETVINAIIQQLSNPTIDVRIYGHSYGGYFASRMLRELIKYYDRMGGSIEPLTRLQVITFGGARFHEYKKGLQNIPADFAPNIRHFIYTKDIIRVINRKILERSDVTVLIPDFKTDTKLKEGLVFHNYEPFIQYIYEHKKLQELAQGSVHKFIVVHIGNTFQSVKKGKPEMFNSAYTVNTIQTMNYYRPASATLQTPVPSYDLRSTTTARKNGGKAKSKKI